MSAPERISGVLAPVVTPFDADLAPDAGRLLRHCRWLLGQGAGLAVFGTTSEGNALSVEEKIALIDRLIEGGCDPARMMPGTGACALPDTVRLTRHAVARGCGGVLMLPPFYYKNVSEDGLYRAFAETIERVGDARLRIYLYHIPPQAVVGFSLGLIDRLVKDFPETVAGIKDSSGDWTNTAAYLSAHWPDFRVFVGSETHLLANMQAGGAGTITATANINPAAILALCEGWRGPDAGALQRALAGPRAAIEDVPMIAAVKHVLAHYAGDPAWRRLRPPLVELTAEEGCRTIAALEAIGFDMPGLAEAVAA